MNGGQDMGGVMGFGPVKPEPNEPVFHGKWEERVLAMTLACAWPGGWTIDMSRSARENIPPVSYLSKSYYEIWFGGLTRLLAERGMVMPDELAAGKALHAPKPVTRIVKAENALPMIAAGHAAERALDTPRRFALGDQVRALNRHPVGHTRLPRYVRGRVGTIVLLHKAHVFPDSNAIGAGESPQWLYTVRFTGRELWGDVADPTLSVSVDAWESYLEPAS
jgi:nitrile hydratase subunit beta